MTVARRSPVVAFYEVRDLPYAIDQAHDADTLLQRGTGDCLAKSDLLGRRLTALGLKVRFVRWLYELPAVLPDVDVLPDRLDLHRALEVSVRGEWLLVDPTHDGPLAAGGLTVADWDGTTDTDGAYPLAGPLRVEGVDDAHIAEARQYVHAWVASCDPSDLAAWRHRYIELLRDIRGRCCAA